MRLFGNPAPPKPPNMIVAPSGMSATASSTVLKTLFFWPIFSREIECPGWGSNPHAPLRTGDFQVPRVCHSATRALITQRYLIKSHSQCIYETWRFGCAIKCNRKPVQYRYLRYNGAMKGFAGAAHAVYGGVGR